MQQTYTIKMNSTTWRAVLASKILTSAKAVLGTSNATFDIFSNALFIKCPPRTAHVLEHELSSNQSCRGKVETRFECHICGKATQGVMLSSCEHVICKECFDREAPTDFAQTTSIPFPLVCSRQGCGESIPLSDLRRLLAMGKLRSVFENCVNYHISLSPEKYRTCRSIGCNTIYLASDSPDVFTCSKCLTQTCTFKFCGKEPHLGWGCEHFKVCLLPDPSGQRLLTD